jgi:16S rRNA processing protein RimM
VVEVVVARVGRAHGVRGEVTVESRTDAPERRFVPGAVLRTDPAGVGPLRLSGVRAHQDRLLLAFEGVEDRTAADGLRGVLLLADLDDDATGAEDDPDSWPDRVLVGLRAELPGGEVVGEVGEVLHRPAQDLLVVRTVAGHDALVPFVRQIVPEVDVAGGRLVLDPPGGLLDPPDA